jgi:hypothetical protein
VSESRLLELGCLLIPAFQPTMTEYCTKPSDIDEYPNYEQNIIQRGPRRIHSTAWKLKRLSLNKQVNFVKEKCLGDLLLLGQELPSLLSPWKQNRLKE